MARLRGISGAVEEGAGKAACHGAADPVAVDISLTRLNSKKKKEEFDLEGVDGAGNAA